MFLAEHPRHGEVALKLLRAGGEEARERFRQEARVACSLRHPGLVRGLESGEAPAGLYLAMERVVGPSLAERCAAGPLDLEVALDLVATLARAVAELHAQGLVHRDLKPENVVSSEAGPVLVDLGSVQDEVVDLDLTVTGEVVGSPAYMAPEQVAGRSSSASDVYALGAILYECLSGSPPISAATALAALEASAAGRIVPLGERVAGLPSAVEEVVGRCLEHDPSRRYGSARELSEDLVRLQRGAAPAPPPAPSPRVPWGLVLGVLALLGLAAWVGGGGEATGSRRTATPGAGLGEARARHLAGEPSAALALLDQRPERGEAALDLRGRVLLSLGRSEEARELYAQGLRARPDSVTYWVGSARAKLRTGALFPAERDAQRALELGPRRLDAHLVLARALAAQGRWGEGHPLYEASQALSADEPEPYAERAGLAFETGEHEACLADVARALALGARWGSLYRLRGLARAARGERKLALADLERALAETPRDLVARYVRANLRLPEDPAGAEADVAVAEELLGSQDIVTKGLELPPISPAQLGVLRARALTRQGRAPAAEAELERVLELRPGYAEALEALVAVRLARGDPEGGAAARRAAVEAYLGRREGADRDGAVRACEAARRLAPREFRVLRALALARLNQGDPKGAVEVFEEALQVEPDNPRALAERGRARYWLSDYEAALADYQRALELEPTLNVVRLWIAEIRIRQRRFSEARRWIEACLEDCASRPEQPRVEGLRHLAKGLLDQLETPD